MDGCEVMRASDNRRSIDSYMEMEYELNSLRSLICELLQTNQELRQALQKATPDGHSNQSSSSSDAGFLE